MKISQNNKFAMSLQYLKEEVRDEVDFLHAGKHHSLYFTKGGDGDGEGEGKGDGGGGVQSCSLLLFTQKFLNEFFLFVTKVLPHSNADDDTLSYSSNLNSLIDIL